MEKIKTTISKTDIILAVLLLGVVVYEIISFVYGNNNIMQSMLDITITRTIAGFFFLIIAIKRSFKLCSFDGRRSIISYLSILPCFIIVINNLPIIALIKGEAVVNASWVYIFVFILQCFAIGFFEEIAFRGVFFLLVLKERHHNKLQLFRIIVISSVIFGMYHLFNLFEGASPVAVIMQVGYSALIGAMCTMIFLQTRNIIIPIIIHAGFDFCGMLVPTLGEGKIWNLPTIIITVILSVAVFLYMLTLYLKYDTETVNQFYKDLQ